MEESKTLTSDKFWDTQTQKEILANPSHFDQVSLHTKTI